MTRAGIDLLWTPSEDSPPSLRVIEVAPIGLLLAACLALMVLAGPVYLYMEGTAAALMDRSTYIDAVRGAPPVGEAAP
jgi:multicomponent K+:H+ antiporter subunit D